MKGYLMSAYQRTQMKFRRYVEEHPIEFVVLSHVACYLTVRFVQKHVN